MRKFACRREYITLKGSVDKFVDKCVNILRKLIVEGKTMRHSAKRQARGKNQQKKPNKMKVYESNGPDAKIRGTAFQITEKYEVLAKDAETSGNYVLAENYRQHAEHYYRIINSFAEAEAQQKAKEEAKAAEKDSNDDDLQLPDSITKAVKYEDEMAAA